MEIERRLGGDRKSAPEAQRAKIAPGMIAWCDSLECAPGKCDLSNRAPAAQGPPRECHDAVGLKTVYQHSARVDDGLTRISVRLPEFERARPRHRQPA